MTFHVGETVYKESDKGETVPMLVTDVTGETVTVIYGETLETIQTKVFFSYEVTR